MLSSVFRRLAMVPALMLAVILPLSSDVSPVQAAVAFGPPAVYGTGSSRPSAVGFR